MKTAEFKVWFEGFTEAMDKVPTKAQWARIKEMVGKIDPLPWYHQPYGNVVGAGVYNGFRDRYLTIND